MKILMHKLVKLTTKSLQREESMNESLSSPGPVGIISLIGEHFNNPPAIGDDSLMLAHLQEALGPPQEVRDHLLPVHLLVHEELVENIGRPSPFFFSQKLVRLCFHLFEIHHIRSVGPNEPAGGRGQRFVCTPLLSHTEGNSHYILPLFLH